MESTVFQIDFLKCDRHLSKVIVYMGYPMAADNEMNTILIRKGW